MAKILILEDDVEIGELVSERLSSCGHVVEHVVGGHDAISLLQSLDFDLLLLDIAVPGPDGLEVLSFAKQMKPGLKVIMLTAKSSIEDKLHGFSTGADDYLPKPFDLRELVARVDVLLKRPEKVQPTCLKHGAVVLDSKNRRLTNNGTDVHLQHQDLVLLEFFLSHPQQTFSSESLLNRLWTLDSNASVGGLRMAISRIRKAIDQSDSNSIIETVGKRGYRLGAG